MPHACVNAYLICPPSRAPSPDDRDGLGAIGDFISFERYQDHLGKQTHWLRVKLARIRSLRERVGAVRWEALVGVVRQLGRLSKGR